MNGSINSDESLPGPDRGGKSDSSAPASQSNAVLGERNTPSVSGTRSLQSRISNLLAAGLMIALGVGGLSWYYASALSRQSHARQAAASAVANNAQGEMVLPPLGGVVTPAAVPDVPSGASVDLAARARVMGALPPGAGNPTAQLDPTGAAGLVQPADAGHVGWSGAGGPLQPYMGVASYPPPRPPVPGDRRLSGAAFARESGQGGSAAETGVGPAAMTGLGAVQGSGATTPAPWGTSGNEAGAMGALREPSAAGSGASSEHTLTTLLRPAVVSAVRAQTLPTQQFLLPKGAFIDCTLETAIDSTLPGMTTCVTATDTFGVDGKVVLLERGSKLIGETRGEVQNGSARVFVLWTQARTPTGVMVPLDSPGTDELGRSGLPGEVNRHFWDRFGAAVLVSVIDGAVQAAAQSTNRSGGAVIYKPATSQDALTEVLKGTINIAPTVTKHQGDRIQILVARDLDFRTVYELRIAGY